MSSVIKSVEKGSLAENAGLKAGDRLVSVNGNDIVDVLDYKYYTYDPRLVIAAETSDGRIKHVKIRKDEGEDIGLEFETYLMDRARACANKCMFCFIDQLPKGLRKTLYFKDDDARLSFLTGNYITLTNLSEREVQRIIDLRVSPINVSVHTTDPELRCRMLGSKRGGEGIDIMRRFVDAGITMDCQIVCCPGINDGEALMSTMRCLADMHPQVRSVSIVPVGLTKYREGLHELEPFDREGAETVLGLVTNFAAECLRETGSRIFFCSDELYLKAGWELPQDEYYEDYPQLENGVGMLRLLTEEFTSALKFADEARPRTFSMATGVSAYPFIKGLAEKAKSKFPGLDGRVYMIENDFFGHTIDVAGLITGGDLMHQLEGKELGSVLYIPQTMLRHGEGVFLDDVTLDDVSARLGVRVVPIAQDGGELLDAMLGILD